PFSLITERDLVIDEVYAAFCDVARKGGVSWAETKVIDGYGGDAERAAARASDTDRTWAELVDDPEWKVFAGVGGWSFLDAIGFRYYLPAATIRCIRSGHDEGVQFHLTLSDRESGLREYTKTTWSLLDERQCRCVARFVDCMILITDRDID